MTNKELGTSMDGSAGKTRHAEDDMAAAESTADGLRWWKHLRVWNRDRESTGGIRASTAAKTMASVLVAGMLANAYVLPPAERRGATVPVFVDGFSSVVVGSTAPGEPTAADTANKVNAVETQWTVQPANSFAFAGGAALVTPQGEVPRTAIVRPGVLLTAVETRFVVPAAYAGIALRFGGSDEFFALVADPNPLYLRLLQVDSGQVKTIDRYYIAGGLLNARVRVDQFNGLTTYVNGQKVGTHKTNDLTQFSGVAGLVALQSSGAGATFDDVIMWADEANIASAAAAAGRGSAAVNRLAELSEEERARLSEAFERLTPEERRQLDSLTPDQIRQLQELAKG